MDDNKIALNKCYFYSSVFAEVHYIFMTDFFFFFRLFFELEKGFVDLKLEWVLKFEKNTVLSFLFSF